MEARPWPGCYDGELRGVTTEGMHRINSLLTLSEPLKSRTFMTIWWMAERHAILTWRLLQSMMLSFVDQMQQTILKLVNFLINWRLQKWLNIRDEP